MQSLGGELGVHGVDGFLHIGTESGVLDCLALGDAVLGVELLDVEAEVINFGRKPQRDAPGEGSPTGAPFADLSRDTLVVLHELKPTFQTAYYV